MSFNSSEDIDAILRDANVGVIFVREGVDTSSPMGQFFRNVCASVAQFEGKLMHERLTKGRLRKAAQGGYIGGHLSFGYKSLDAHAVVDEKAAEVVRLMFRLRIEGRSFSEIVAELKRREVKTARGSHKPIISVKTFNKAQDIFRCAADRARFESTRIRLPEGAAARNR
ncbi:MAG: recombinase family protein [Planctomycetota bacterium]